MYASDVQEWIGKRKKVERYLVQRPCLLISSEREPVRNMEAQLTGTRRCTVMTRIMQKP